MKTVTKIRIIVSGFCVFLSRNQIQCFGHSFTQVHILAAHISMLMDSQGQTPSGVPWGSGPGSADSNMVGVVREDTEVSRCTRLVDTCRYYCNL